MCLETIQTLLHISQNAWTIGLTRISALMGVIFYERLQATRARL